MIVRPIEVLEDLPRLVPHGQVSRGALVRICTVVYDCSSPVFVNIGWGWFWNTVRCQSSHKYSQKTPHSSPARVTNGVSFVNPASDWYSALVPVIIYVISYNIGQRYNDTRLFKHSLITKPSGHFILKTSLCIYAYSNLLDAQTSFSEPKNNIHIWTFTSHKMIYYQVLKSG